MKHRRVVRILEHQVNVALRMADGAIDPEDAAFHETRARELQAAIATLRRDDDGQGPHGGHWIAGFTAGAGRAPTFGEVKHRRRFNA